ncbi:UDP-N-acetylmuramate--alanine ligase [Enhygromyxa salina]|uniref:UDP-N-acetylmuramate--alanine ligase n=1 Tax=Enhygromyxa salina TaxID=215803 RepID=A0A0C1ZUJ6_9BACT|nr:Mur ligase domain-containing protein [Enhygromyxa salina]KIG14698.1 UDP-N-acetylmuramate--alanine ligase [Enhygromyxa salina]
MLKPGSRLHLLGIGGVGMSALAHVAARRGYVVSGSDAQPSPNLDRLRAAGIDARSPHGSLGACDLVARSPAVADTHPLVREAGRAGLPILSRAELLAALLPAPERVAVAGTHGKSTTTAMLAHILITVGRDPTVVLGANAPILGGGHRIGSEPIALFEACEGYGALDQTPAPIVCLGNVDDDHVEQFSSRGGFAAIVASFERLCTGAARGLALGVDDARLRAWSEDHLGGTDRPVWGFGLHASARVRGERCGPSECELHVDGRRAGRVRLWAPGAHNLRNALGAIATAGMLGVDPPDAALALSSFAGVSRRLQRLGQVGGALVLDDYAHHPSEVAAAIEAARSEWPAARLIAVFEPHLPSREQRLRERFATALAGADVIVVTPVHAGRERDRGQTEFGIADCLDRARAEAGRARQVIRAEGLDEAVSITRGLAQSEDVVLVMGTGGVSRVAHALVGCRSTHAGGIAQLSDSNRVNGR